ncbi:DUF2335 domain-containing protein [Rickettsiaceae bacterium]|nr:DUF2335 domain-containing protein [Rickettsiaceae bacterium]
MKETKKYFDNNRLNRGYSKVSNFRQSDVHSTRKQYNHVLPPIDMMEQYEEVHPGTFDKLLDMAEKEQNHRHSMDLLAMEKHNRATRLGRVFALIFVGIISATTLMLVIADSVFAASIFASTAFASIAIISYLYSKNSINKEFKRRPQRSPDQRFDKRKPHSGNRNYHRKRRS